MPTVAGLFRNLHQQLNMRRPLPQNCSNFFLARKKTAGIHARVFPAKQNEPERHSLPVFPRHNFQPKPANAVSTPENSDRKIPANTSVPPGFTCATIFFRSAINRLEIKFAQTRSNERPGFNSSLVTSPRLIFILPVTSFTRAFSRETRTDSG